jgi:hypothetical protein
VSGGWRVTVGFEAQRDLWTFGWEPEREVGGVVCGRFETSGINRRDDGKSLFIRRVLRSDYGGDATSVDINFGDVERLQTIMTTGSSTRIGPGRTGGDDVGVFVGSIHSHPGVDRQREPSDTDLRSAAGNARHQPPGLAGKPWLMMLATAGEAWDAGMPSEDWTNPTYDLFLVSADRTIVKPHVSYMSEIEWLVEEGQRAFANGGD